MNRRIVLASFVSLSLEMACTVPDADVPGFSLSVANEADQVTYQTREGSTSIDVRSPGGIGSARFDLASGEMPEKLVITLHLAGLEEFRLSSGGAFFTAGVSRSGVFASDRRLKVRVVPTDAAPTTPLDQGYFEVEVAGDLLRESGHSFEIRWIDFFR